MRLNQTNIGLKVNFRLTTGLNNLGFSSSSLTMEGRGWQAVKGRYKWREFELDELSEILDIICDYPISETLALKVAIGILKLKPELIPMFRRKCPIFFDTKKKTNVLSLCIQS